MCDATYHMLAALTLRGRLLITVRLRGCAILALAALLASTILLLGFDLTHLLRNMHLGRVGKEVREQGEHHLQRKHVSGQGHLPLLRNTAPL